jgi:hypothetical protein
MSLIYIANPQGQQITYEEQEARRLWIAGMIPQNSIYWREGMSDWRPAIEYFGAPQSQSTPAAPPLIAVLNNVTRGFVKDPTSRTKALIGWLWAYLGAAVIAVLTSAIALATGLVTKLDPDNFTAMDLINICVGLPQALIHLVTGVVFLTWIYRANVNARGLGAEGMTFTPGWAVGYYFIPIMNLWRPFQAMKEIWQASENPISWPSIKPPALLNLWWGLWIVSCVLGNAAFRASFRANSATELIVSEVITILSDLVEIPLCLAAIRLVREIIRMQGHWAAQGAPSVCAVCHQPFAESEMIILNGSPVCYQCKPVIVQRMQEGLPIP